MADQELYGRRVKSKVVYDYMFAAMADTFGGYLQSYGLPLMHEAYYEGYVSYDTAVEFHRLQDDFKSILMTSGDGWTRPMEVRKHINRVLPLKLPGGSTSKPCGLLLSDASCKALEDVGGNQSSSIPLPILDDSKQPGSMAVPFKNRALYNLNSRGSYDILIKYYIEASRCIAQTQESGMEQSQFERLFSEWLKDKVFPHLKDESWYVGFSNVLRIEETIQQRGGIIGLAPPSKEVEEESSLFSELESETQLNSSAYIVILLILLILVFFICFLYWAVIKNCILCCGKVDVDPSSCEDGNPTDTTSLLSNSDDYSNPSSCRKKCKRFCKHTSAKSDSDRLEHTQSARTVSEESRLTMSCGLGRAHCHKHKH